MQVWGSVSATRLGIAMRKGMAARGRGRRGGGDVQVGLIAWTDLGPRRCGCVEHCHTGGVEVCRLRCD